MLRRARQPEQKEKRRNAILEAARQCLAEAGFQDVTMADVAKKAALGKGTLYLYFQTKEELFLGLLEAELEIWYADVTPLLDAAPVFEPAQTIRTLADAAAAMLDARPTFRRLLAIMGSILEQNIEYDRAVAFKERVVELAEAAGTKLESLLGFLQPGEGVFVLQRLYAIAMGLQQLSEPAPVMRQALEEPHLRRYKLQFHREFADTAYWYLIGMAARAQMV